MQRLGPVGAGEATPPALAWGLGGAGGGPPSPARFAVELDQRFLTELAHTTVLFNELFDQSGRRQLVKVPPPLALRSPLPLSQDLR